MNKFLVNRADYAQYKVVEEATPLADDLGENQVLLKIDAFSFTSNNITYAVVGDQIGYWKFFPVEEGWGIIPAWGFADVLISKAEGIKEGQRFYGYFPMASHLVVEAGKIQPFGFVDVIPHRQSLPPIYNFYTNTKFDPVYTKETEALQSILRPLFTTSFLIDDLLGANDFYGAKNIILTSASSKTGYALAFLLAARKAKTGLDYTIIGLTSERNVDFVEALGYYDEVLKYDDLNTIDTSQKAVIVDFSGNHNLQYNLQIHLNTALVYNCLVGMVHWEDRRGDKKLPKRGQFFFAPDHARRRNKEWGAVGFQKRLGASWNAFITQAAQWISVEEFKGSEALGQLHTDMLQGKVNPKAGNMVEL